MQELARGAGGRCGLLDLYWLARHGQPLPPVAWPAVLWVREVLADPYTGIERMITGVAEALGEGDGETQN